MSFVGLCLLAQLLPSGVYAQTQQIDQARAERDAQRAERIRAAQDVDAIKSSNEEVEAALRLLEEELAARQGELDATNAQVEQARAEVFAAQAEVAAEQAKIEELRAQLQEQAITAYVQPDNEGDDVLGARDLIEGERRKALVSAVQSSRADILDQLRVAEANKDLAVARALAAERDIEARQLIAERQRAEAQEARNNQERLVGILQARILDFQNEVDVLAAEEAELQAELNGLIVEEEQRQAAIREQQRIAEERRRIAEEEERRRQQRLEDERNGITPAQESTISRADAGLVNAPEASPGRLVWPVQGILTSRFGPRWGRQHNGIDVGADTGTTVTAAGSGTVIAAGSSGAFGNRVLIQHAGGIVTLYAHLSSINVSNGQSVSTGTSIGAVGCTGSCTGPHLHFEVRVGGVAYDPLQYLG